MAIIGLNQLKYAVFALAKEKGMLPYGVGMTRFYRHPTQWVKLPDYCRLVVETLKRKGVNMWVMRSKLLLVTNLAMVRNKKK